MFIRGSHFQIFDVNRIRDGSGSPLLFLLVLCLLNEQPHDNLGHAYRFLSIIMRSFRSLGDYAFERNGRKDSWEILFITRIVDQLSFVAD